MRWRPAAALVGLFLAVGCSGPSVSSAPPDPIVASTERDLLGRWTDESGQELPDGTNDSGGILVLAAGSGSTTCTDENVTVFLRLAWPVGTSLDWSHDAWDNTDAPQYVRDTTDPALTTDGSSVVDVAQPARARRTGYGLRGNALSVVPDDPRAVYITRPDGTVERRARLRSGAGCA